MDISVITNSMVDGSLEALLLGGGVSLVLQMFKSWLSVQSKRLITILLIIFSVGATALHYLLDATNADPALFGQTTAAVVGLATLAYRILIKPATQLLVDARAFREQTQLGVAAAASTIPEAYTEATPTLLDEPTNYEENLETETDF